VYVRWLDSVRHMSGWLSAEDYARDADYSQLVHETLGWLIQVKAHSIVVALSRSEVPEDRTLADAMQIPICSVIEWWTLDAGALQMKVPASGNTDAAA
jgi:hypothetical protein